MSMLPSTWAVEPLESLAEVRLGRQRSPKNHSGPQMRPYLRAANVDWDGIKLDDIKHMQFSHAEMDTFRLEPGDLLLNEASGSPDEVGKPGLWRGEVADCAFQNTLLRVRPGPSVDPRYLLHFFRHEALSGRFARRSRGVGIHHLGRKVLASWSIPVPPLGEQQRIVTILDDHLSRLDAALEFLRQGEARLGGLTRAVLAHAVPTAAPAHWRVTTVGEAGEVQLGRQRHPDWHNGPMMRPYLRVANVFEDRIDATDVMEMDFSGVFERFRLEPGDVLLNEGQSPEWLGRPAIYRGEPKEVAFTNSLLRFKARSDVMPEWALLVFRRHMHLGRFRKESRITTNIAHLSATRLKAVEFPLPSLSEQERLVQSTTVQLESVDRIGDEVTARRAQAASLRRALLAAAFSGRLTSVAELVDPQEEMAGV